MYTTRRKVYFKKLAEHTKISVINNYKRYHSLYKHNTIFIKKCREIVKEKKIKMVQELNYTINETTIRKNVSPFIFNKKDIDLPNASTLLDPSQIEIQNSLIKIVCTVFKNVFETELSNDIAIKLFTKPKPDLGDFSIACFILPGQLNKKVELLEKFDIKSFTPKNIANIFGNSIKEYLNDNITEDIKGIRYNGICYIQSLNIIDSFINIIMKPSTHSFIIESIQSGEYTTNMEKGSKEKVMIEYSQPNTHKAFHVGHIRNVVLGNFLINQYEIFGYDVVAANYFGDEGAHVAKCLWYLLYIYLPKAQEAYKNNIKYDINDPESIYPFSDIDDIDTVPIERRSEWLGSLYAKAIEILSLDYYTSLPYEQLICACIKSIDKHPNPKVPSTWNIVTIDIGKDKQIQVVCGGTGYTVGDKVVYLPVGKRLKKKLGTIIVKDIFGVDTNGILIPEEYLCTIDDDDDDGVDDDVTTKNNNDKKTNSSLEYMYVSHNKTIKQLPKDSKVGECIVEFGKQETFKENTSIMEYYTKLRKQADDVLHKLEIEDPFMTKLWHKTSQWSLDAFHDIYEWIGARFDHDFKESQVSKPSMELVKTWYKEGKLDMCDGAIVANLQEYNLGRCVQLKSNGSGLYATKDLSLATLKFDKYNIDKSIYVVDVAQSLHFKQVFKIQELCGYKEKASKCLHIAYALVTLPSGKMSSRKGNILLFSDMKRMIENMILSKYPLNNTIDNVTLKRIAVASINYGMLNHDCLKDIVFEMDKWTNNTGNTGPYILYAYSRIQSILSISDIDNTKKFNLSKKLNEQDINYKPYINIETNTIDFTKFIKSIDGQKFLSLADFDRDLSTTNERLLLFQFHRFWCVLLKAKQTNNSSIICEYLFQIAQLFSTWYEQVRLTQVPLESIPSKIILLQCTAMVLSALLKVLNINTVQKM